MDSSVSSSSSFTPVTVVRSSVATDSSEVTGSATSCEVSDSRLNMLHSSTMELSHGAGASVSSEFVSADDIPVSHLFFVPLQRLNCPHHLMVPTSDLSQWW